MMRYLLTAICLAPASVYAWEFTSPITISELDNGVHHLQTATARALAVSKDAVAIVWEDNHDGKPAIYFSIKPFTVQTFTPPRKLSTETAAFEPAIASDGKRFVVMWESAAQVHGSICDLHGCTGSTQLSDKLTRQVSLTQDANGKLYFAWATKLTSVYQLQAGEVTIENNALVIHQPINVTPTPKQPQSYPSISVLPQGWTVAFEDRERGHTVLMTTFKPAGKTFLPAQVLNDIPPPRNTQFGAGTGAMRPQLTDDGKSNVTVVWLDKRDFQGGYDVYAAVSKDAGKTFGHDEKVQDPLGEEQPQWQANIAMSRDGKIFSTWADPRDGTMDIWYSTRHASGWSDDEPIPGANNKGVQNNPSLVFDAAGRLHIAYVDIQTNDGKKMYRIRYLTAME